MSHRMDKPSSKKMLSNTTINNDNQAYVTKMKIESVKGDLLLLEGFLDIVLMSHHFFYLPTFIFQVFKYFNFYFINYFFIKNIYFFLSKRDEETPN